MADGVERTLEQSLRQAERLRQGVLKKAFEGKLVAQDERDEPAGVLVERIRRERFKKGEKRKTANLYELIRTRLREFVPS